MRTTLLKHGGVLDIRAEPGNRVVGKHHRILFWRDPSSANGADICVETFRVLATKFPQISIVAAVREGHWENWGVRFSGLTTHYRNINLSQCPYSDEIKLAQLLTEAICVLLPFRKLSYHPQLSVLESIAFGSTVITTSLESNIELADNGNSAV